MDTAEHNLLILEQENRQNEVESGRLSLNSFKDRLRSLIEGGFEVVSNLLFYLTDIDDNGELSNKEVSP